MADTLTQLAAQLAATIAGKLPEPLSESAIAQITTLRQQLHNKFQHNSAATKTLAAVEQGSQADLAPLVEHLQSAMQQDAQFAAQMQAIAQAIHPETLQTSGDMTITAFNSQAFQTKVAGGTAYIGNNYNVTQTLPPPRQLSLHQLPNDIADFTGRTTQIEQLTAHLQSAQGRTAVAISAVAGMAGIGKSTLAIHIAHQLKPQFPDAQLYINLRGADDQPLPPLEILGQWLRTFGFDDSTIPTDLLGRSAVYRSWLASKRALVLLDNAQNANHVEPLLPGSETCAVLIISRYPLGSLPGAKVINLTVMPEAEAINFFTAIIGTTRLQANPDAARQIILLCGGLPNGGFSSLAGGITLSANDFLLRI